LRPLTEEQVQLAVRMVKALSEKFKDNPNGNGAG
jgi:hypothetical protein